MTPRNVKALLKKLPYRKHAIISKRMEGKVSARQVQCVFAGEITNPKIVKPVLTVALKIAQETIKIPRKKMSTKKSA